LLSWIKTAMKKLSGRLKVVGSNERNLIYLTIGTSLFHLDTPFGLRLWMVFHYTSIIISFVKPFSCTNIFIYQCLLLQHVCLPCFHVSLMLLLTLFFHEQFLGKLFVVWNGYVLVCIDFVGVGVQFIFCFYMLAWMSNNAMITNISLDQSSI
jgi:hypothetical protein